MQLFTVLESNNLNRMNVSIDRIIIIYNSIVDLILYENVNDRICNILCISQKIIAGVYDFEVNAILRKLNAYYLSNVSLGIDIDVSNLIKDLINESINYLNIRSECIAVNKSKVRELELNYLTKEAFFDWLSDVFKDDDISFPFTSLYIDVKRCIRLNFGI